MEETSQAFRSWKHALFIHAVLKEFSGDAFMIEVETAVNRCNAVLLERAKSMEISLREGARIGNPRNYSPREVAQLHELLAAGSTARRDPRRQNFYEVEGQEETYYIFVSPVSGEVVLLAKWKAQTMDCCFSAGHFIA